MATMRQIIWLADLASAAGLRIRHLEVIACLALYLYSLSRAWSNPAKDFAFPLLVALLAGALLPRRHWVSLLTLAVASYYFALRLALGNVGLGTGGDRDDAVVIVAQSLLAGSYSPDLRPFTGNPITTGPVSGLLSLPFVALTGSDNVLSALLFLLLVGVLRWRHSDGPLLPVSLAMFALFPTFQSDYLASNEELSYGWLFMLPAAHLAQRAESARRAAAFGALCALAVGVRPSYAYAALFLAVYWAIGARRNLWLVAGLAGAGVLIAVTLPYALQVGYVRLAQGYVASYTSIGPAQAGTIGSALALLTPLILALLTRRLTLHLAWGVIAATMVGHLASHLLFVPFHLLYWAIPVLYWLPEAGRWLTHSLDPQLVDVICDDHLAARRDNE